MSTFSTASPQLHPATQSQSSARRPYRSKRNRPCALCRSRKISCRTVDNDPSCTSCRKGKRQCSFLEDPPSIRVAHAVITASDTTGRGAVESAVTFNEDQSIDRSESAVPDRGMVYGHLNDGDRLELSSFYDGSQDLSVFQDDRMHPTPWLDSLLESAHHEPNLHSGHTSHRHIDPQLCPTNIEILPDDAFLGNTGDLNVGDIPPNIFPSPLTAACQSPGAVSIVRQPTTDDTLNEETTTGSKSGLNTIDQRPGFHSSYFGLSGECDPYLLRHVLYDESDEKPFNRLWYRATETEQALSSPNNDVQSSRVPVQFMMVASELVEEVEKTGPTHSPQLSAQTELNGLVSEEHGRRLVLLFMEYVFPALPVVSRSQLARNILSSYPSQSQSLAISPPYLLAAIYASALQFGSYDDVLCVSSLYQKPSAERLWQMVYDGIQSQVHSPTLATLSASLLYLNKARVGVQIISVDTSFTWTFTASTVALATSLGIHIDCKTWSIPGWEKRLRRRLWWITFSEEKWRSLLLGRPSIIAKDQWSVSTLTDQDFEMDQADVFEPQNDCSRELKSLLKSLCQSGDKPVSRLQSQHMTSLALIVDDVYTALYTIRATQFLASDLTASINAVRPLRESLVQWYSDLPMTLRSQKKFSPEISAVPLVPNSIACLHFAYITLEVLLYRALLRPLANVDFEQEFVNAESGGPGNDTFSTGAIAHSGSQDDHWDLETSIASDGNPRASFRRQAEAIICAAEQCATVVTTFTAELMSWDFAGFWYSWSRIGWATTSSFLALLLVQSPSVEHATTAKSLMDKWRQILRHQSKSFQEMSLGMTRLDAMYWYDMRKLFRVNRHLDKVL